MDLPKWNLSTKDKIEYIKSKVPNSFKEQLGDIDWLNVRKDPLYALMTLGDKNNCKG